MDTAPANGAILEVNTFTQTDINVPVNDTIKASHLNTDIISGLTEVTAVSGDKLMILDATDSALKKTDVNTLMATAVSISSSADAVALTFDSNENATFAGNINLADNSRAKFGAGNDLQIYHDGSDSYINGLGTGNVIIRNSTDDADILFQSDDGSGSITTYITVDGSAVLTQFSKDTKHTDSVEATFGNSTDLRIAHDGTDSFITNNTGDLYFNQLADDKDILFRSDDGSGGITTYFFLDGSGTRTQFEQHTRHIDNIYAAFGSDADLRIFHDGSNSYIRQSSGATGNLIIEQDLTDADILFKGDDGGSTITALTLSLIHI